MPGIKQHSRTEKWIVFERKRLLWISEGKRCNKHKKLESTDKERPYIKSLITVFFFTVSTGDQPCSTGFTGNNCSVSKYFDI